MAGHRTAAALGIDLSAQPGYSEIMAARADRMAVMRGIVAGPTDAGLGQPCQRSPTPGYPDEERTVIDCLGVVIGEEIEHYRFAARDLAVLESAYRAGSAPARPSGDGLGGRRHARDHPASVREESAFTVRG